MVILKKMLKDFNDGRSKSYYCLSATLLSVKDLEDCLNKTEKQTKNDDFKTKAKKLKENLEKTAIKDKIKLKLNKPPHWKK